MLLLPEGHAGESPGMFQKAISSFGYRETKHNASVMVREIPE
jgi:hypothetical protein